MAPHRYPSWRKLFSFIHSEHLVNSKSLRLCVCGGGSCISVILYKCVLYCTDWTLTCGWLLWSAQPRFCDKIRHKTQKYFGDVLRKYFPCPVRGCAAVVTVTGWEDTRHCAGFRDGPRLHSQEIELIAKSVSMDILRLDIFQTSEIFLRRFISFPACNLPCCLGVSEMKSWSWWTLTIQHRRRS